MIGNMIYLLFRQDLVRGGSVLESPHATFDGAAGKLDDYVKYWTERGEVIYDNKADVIVGGVDGTPLYHYYVVSRTILK